MNNTIVTFLSEFEGHQAFINFLTKIFGENGVSFGNFLVFFLAAFIIVNIMAVIGGLGTYAERKISADLQARMGPNRVGPYGLLQFLADGVKMFLKEDIIPAKADKFLYIIAPMLCMVGVFATLAVLPISSGFALSHLNVGIFYLVGVSSLVGLGIFLGGYASNSKWSLLGGMRGASQIISYEIPVTISILSIVLLAGGLSFDTIVEGQTGLPHKWYIFHNPFTFIGFFVFFIGALAETNRAPFDLPEAESELVSGYHTEYSGMRFAFFALAEYVEVFVLCGVCAALYLGGYKVPFGLGTGEFFQQVLHLPAIIANVLGQLMQVGAFFTKAFLLYYVVIWIRWTLPRLRVDQLMTVCWKYLTPIALFNLVGCAFWMYLLDGKPLYSLLFEGAKEVVSAHH
jgi:NADH-quinone oxidoreductase subunit H